MKQKIPWLRLVEFGIILGVVFVVAGVLLGFSWSGLLVAAVSAVVGLGVTHLPRWMFRTDRALIRRVDRVAEGDLTLEFPVQGGAQALTGSLRKMLGNIRRIVAKVKHVTDNLASVSTQVLSRTREVSEGAQHQAQAVEQTFHSMERVNESLHRISANVEELKTFIDETSSFSLELTASTDEVNQHTSSLSQMVEETSSEISEMVASIRSVAESCQDLATFAIENSSSMVEMDASIAQVNENVREFTRLFGDVVSRAKEGQHAVKETMEGFAGIQGFVDEATTVMTNLQKRSGEIGDILKVIKEVADQTNLLALNAAIIAAQAREKGRGFAVVADEIRDLSERTGASTDEIKRVVSNVQSDVGSAIRTMSMGRARVEEGVGLGSRAEEALQKILQASENVTSSLRKITQATEEQIKGSHQVAQATEEMSQKIETISRATREQAETSQRISERGVHMSDITGAVKRAMEEQLQGSQRIEAAVQRVVQAVAEVKQLVGGLDEQNQDVLTAMEVIQQSGRENLGVARELAREIMAVQQEALILQDGISQFVLPKPRFGGTVRTGFSGKAEFKMDPIASFFVRDAEVNILLYEGLLRYGQGTDIQPCLAESWQTSADGKTYTFRLKRGVRFHNGREVKAEDAAYSFHRVLGTNHETSQTAWVLEPLVGAREYQEGKVEQVSGIRVLDEYTLELELVEPVPFFLSLLALPETCVVPKEEVERWGEAFVHHPCGTGPFRLDALSNGQLRLGKNDQYHVPGIPHVDAVEFRGGFPDAVAVRSALERGEIHYINMVPPKQLEEFLEDDYWKGSIQHTVQLHTYYLLFNVRTPPLDQKAVRLAINYAIDRETFVQRFLGPGAEVAKGLLPPGLLGYSRELKGFSYDPERARALLREAGVQEAIIPFNVPRESEAQRRQAEFLREALEQVGIRLEVTELPEEEYTRFRSEGSPTMFPRAWLGDFPDPDNFFYVLFHSRNSQHLKGFYHNPELDKLIERARTITDVQARETLYQQAERLLLEDPPAVFLYHQRGYVVHQPGLAGVKLYYTPPMVRPIDMWFLEPQKA